MKHEIMKNHQIWTSKTLGGRLALTNVKSATEKDARIAVRKRGVFCEGDEDKAISTLLEMLLSLPKSESNENIGCNSSIRYIMMRREYEVSTCFNPVFSGLYEDVANKLVIG